MKNKQNKKLKKVMESVLCWPTPPGHGACCGVWLRHSVGDCEFPPFPADIKFK